MMPDAIEAAYAAAPPPPRRAPTVPRPPRLPRRPRPAGALCGRPPRSPLDPSAPVGSLIERRMSARVDVSAPAAVIFLRDSERFKNPRAADPFKSEFVRLSWLCFSFSSFSNCFVARIIAFMSRKMDERRRRVAPSFFLTS